MQHIAESIRTPSGMLLSWSTNYATDSNIDSNININGNSSNGKEQHTHTHETEEPREKKGLLPSRKKKKRHRDKT